jgi:hypothetical protein
MTSVLNFIKIYQLVQKLLGGDIQTDRQTGDLISLTFHFKESRLIKHTIQSSATVEHPYIGTGNETCITCSL